MFRKIEAAQLAQISPELFALSQEVLFGDIWSRPQLSTQQRCLITLSVLILQGRYSQLDWHVKNALKQGLTAPDILELLLHLVMYIGFPQVISALEHMPEEIWSCP